MSHEHQLNLADQLFSPEKRTTRTAQFLRKIDKVVDWKKLANIVRVLDKTSPKKGGRPRLPVMVMVKSLFLQQFYGLSDPQLEEQINDRLSFAEFVGLSLSRKAPDFTSFWKFKEELSAQGLEDKLFDEVQRQLDDKGLIIRKGTIVDATMIESTNRTLSKKKRQKLEENPSPQIDSEARSTKKRATWYYGYKGHIGMDAESKIIRKCVLTPANVHDSQLTEELVSYDEKGLFGDKGYADDRLKKMARMYNWYYGMQDKARRGQALSGSQKERNRKLSSVRSAVEHPFAWMKSQAGNAVACAKSLARNRVRFHMSCMCWNLKQASLLLANAP